MKLAAVLIAVGFLVAGAPPPDAADDNTVRLDPRPRQRRILGETNSQVPPDLMAN